MTPTEYMETMALVEALWSRPVKTETMMAGEELLLDIQFVAAREAVMEMATAGREFPPTIGMIRKRAIELTSPLFPTGDQMLKEIHSEIARCGWVAVLPNGRQPKFSHPAIAQLVDAFGWQELCESDNEVADRAHLIRLYSGICDRMSMEERMPESTRSLRDRSERGGEPSSLADSLGAIAIGPTPKEAP